MSRSTLSTTPSSWSSDSDKGIQGNSAHGVRESKFMTHLETVRFNTEAVVDTDEQVVSAELSDSGMCSVQHAAVPR